MSLLLLGSLWICLQPIPSFSEPSPPESQPSAYPLSLEEATQRALDTYERLKIAQSDVAIAKGNEWQSYSLALPNIQGNYQYQRNITTPSIFFETGRVPIGLDNEHNFQVNVAQPLTKFGGILQGIKSARLETQSSRESLKQSVADVIYASRQAYFDTLLRRSQLVVAELTRDDAKEILRREEARFRVGEIPEFDYNRAKLDFDNRDADVIQARGNYESAQESLKRVAGFPLETQLRLTDTMDKFAGPLLEEKALQKFQESNPRVASLRKNAESLEEARKAARSDFFPYLNFFLNYQGSGQSNQFIPSSSEFFNALAVGVNVQIPIFDGMLTLGKYKSAQARSMRASWERWLTEKDMLVQLKQALIEAKTRMARKESDREGVRVAETLYRQAELRQKNGMITFIDLKDVQNQLELARLRYLNSLYNYVISRAQIEQLVGSSLYDE